MTETKRSLPEQEVLLGNVAIGWGLVRAGCQFATSYPGTPSSEILPAVVAYAKHLDLPVYTEWSFNEKVALEVGLAASISGKRTAVIMKQVGLNVAADPLMSAAYMGTVGGLVLVVADDPGPHSSQTEQDTRAFGRFAKVAVFDPESPAEAIDMLEDAFELSERHRMVTILRPSLRVCHAKQSIRYDSPRRQERSADFPRDPARWAATPRDRYRLHLELNEKLVQVAAETRREARWNHPHGPAPSPDQRAFVACGLLHARLMDGLRELGLADSIPVFKVGQPTPMDPAPLDEFVAASREVLILETPDAAVEEQLAATPKLHGRRDGTVPGAGELTPEMVESLVRNFLEREVERPVEGELAETTAGLDLPVRRPTLCAGCPHRASFWALRRELPRGILPSDIGCYTLGKNLKAVDTCLDMGAAISMASGFYHAHAQDGLDVPVFATIGDSTFFASGMTGLANAVVTGARLTLVILDNGITAMTGMQPVPTTGELVDGSQGIPLSLEETVRALGVKHVEVADPYQVDELRAVIRRAREHNLAEDGGVAVIISRHPCLIHIRYRPPKERRIHVNEECNACGYCVRMFECPAMALPEGAESLQIDPTLCAVCGVCTAMCPRDALELQEVTT